jgi:hypothetical protein
MDGMNDAFDIPLKGGEAYSLKKITVAVIRFLKETEKKRTALTGTALT